MFFSVCNINEHICCSLSTDIFDLETLREINVRKYFCQTVSKHKMLKHPYLKILIKVGSCSTKIQCKYILILKSSSYLLDLLTRELYFTTNANECTSIYCKIDCGFIRRLNNLSINLSNFFSWMCDRQKC